jgi:hypothetical protein
MIWIEVIVLVRMVFFSTQRGTEVLPFAERLVEKAGYANTKAMP